MKKFIVGLGEILWDMLPEGKQLGGAPANFAYHVGQFGLNGCAVSAIGNDSLGQEILEQLGRRRMNVCLERTAYPTGCVDVTLDKDGVPQYEIKQNVAWDNIPWSAKIQEIAENTMVVCYGSLAQRNSVTRQTIHKFLDVMPLEATLRVFDINLRQHFYTKDIISDSLKRCDVLKINDEELLSLREMFELPDVDVKSLCGTLLSMFGLKMLILTCGVNGSYVFASDTTSFIPTPKVEVVDTVGAGDSFTAAFCSAMLKGRSIEIAHKLAVDVSAFVCTQKGAMPELPASLISILD